MLIHISDPGEKLAMLATHAEEEDPQRHIAEVPISDQGYLRDFMAGRTIVIEKVHHAIGSKQVTMGKLDG